MVLVGKVTALSRPGGQADGVGSVAFAVSDTLKGAPVDSIDARWKEKFVYSCEPAEQFHNVGFRQGGSFIVYIRDGEVFRAAAADELRSGLLSLEDERGIVASGG